MKIGVVGTGLVGSTSAYAMVMEGVGSEIFLVDKNRKRAEAEAADILHAVPFSHRVRVAAGDYPDLAGSRLVIVSAGVNQSPGETRLALLQRNADVFADVIPRILERFPDALLLVATNPVDVMTHLAADLAVQHGIPSTRVIGSGTTLDTARFRSLLGRHVGVDPQHVHGYVLGEHGDSEVLTWSLVTVGVEHLADFCRARGVDLSNGTRAEIDQEVRQAAYRIIEGKGATYYGIGSAIAHIANVVLNDYRAILTVSARTDAIEGVHDVTISLPRLVGGDGVLATFIPVLSKEESVALQKSARFVKQTIEQLRDNGA
jgi:L-lactate dehydrogenase